MILRDDKGNCRFLGKWRGFVVDVDDPKKLYRLRATVPDISGQDIGSKWASPQFPTGGAPNEGTVSAIRKGQAVWIEFEQGLINRPIWTGFCVYEPEGISDIPKIAREEQGDPASGGTKGTDTASTHTGAGVNEPSVPALATYPQLTAFRSKSGLVEEWDDSGPRHQVFHPSGTYREERDDGTVVDKSVKNRHEIALESILRHAKDLLEVIDNDSIKTVLGKIDEESQTRNLNVKGSLTGLINTITATLQNGGTLTVDTGALLLEALSSLLLITVNSLTISSQTTINLTALGAMTLAATGIATISGATINLNGGISIGGIMLPSPLLPNPFMELGAPGGFFLINQTLIPALEAAFVAASAQSYVPGTITSAGGAALTTLVKAI